ncbi:MAG TPA: TetR family transcriptional regulator [Actinomycetota bacterium]|nr:TetR family transcriptional regulator [Actinomycetota bacterium]
MATKTLTEKQEARRQRVIQAALEAAASGGYDAVQMRDVAAEAGVALGTLYRYFSSKDQLLVATLAQWARELQQEIATHPLRGESPADRVVEVLRRAVKALETAPKLTTALVTALSSMSSEDPEALAYADNVAGTMAEIIAGAVDGGTEQHTAAVRALGLLWFATLVAWVRGWGPPEQMMEDLESAARLLFR